MKISIFQFAYLFLISFFSDGIFAKEGMIPLNGMALSSSLSIRRSNKSTFFRGHGNSSISSSRRNNNNNNKNSTIESTPRGGACSDSNLQFFAKIGVCTILESVVLFGVLYASVKISDAVPSITLKLYNQPILELVASMMIIFGSSFFGSIVDGGLSAASKQALNPTMVSGNPNWFASLDKPSWNPPGWVFPIMWLIVSKPTQLCAMSRIFKYGIKKVTGENTSSTSFTTTFIPSLALFVYTTHLALGDTWNKVFFGLQCIGRGTVVITIFFAFLLASTYLFYTIDAGAGYYMLPTCFWVFVATALQWSIYLKNKNKK